MKNYLLFILILSFSLVSVGATLVSIPMNQDANHIDGFVVPTFTIISTGTTIGVGGGFTPNRGFLDFNLSVIPTTATITNVSIQLTVIGADTSTVQALIKLLHQLLLEVNYMLLVQEQLLQQM